MLRGISRKINLGISLPDKDGKCVDERFYVGCLNNGTKSYICDSGGGYKNAESACKNITTNCPDIGSGVPTKCKYPCQKDEDCEQGYSCVENECVSNLVQGCQKNEDCTENQYCYNNNCIPFDENYCDGISRDNWIEKDKKWLYTAFTSDVDSPVPENVSKCMVNKIVEQYSFSEFCKESKQSEASKKILDIIQSCVSNPKQCIPPCSSEETCENSICVKKPDDGGNGGNGNSKDGLSKGAWVGIIAGIVVFFILLGFVISRKDSNKHN